MNLQELLDKLPPEDRQIVLDHFIGWLSGKQAESKEIVLRRTAKISTLGSEEDMIKEISNGLGFPEEVIRAQNITSKLQALTERHSHAQEITKGFKDFLIKSKARRDKFEELEDLGNFMYSEKIGNTIVLPDAIDTIPDFVLSDEKGMIGIEHTRLINSETKAIIKETVSILKKAEQLLLQRDNDRKQLINISINYWNLVANGKGIVANRFSIQEKNNIARVVADYVDGLILKQEVSKPLFIDNIFISERSKHALSIELNETYLGKDDFEQLMLSTLKRKEAKFLTYKKKSTIKELWLLVVYNGVTASSSYIPSTTIIDEKFSSQFDRVILFDGFSHERILVYSKSMKKTQ